MSLFAVTSQLQLFLVINQYHLGLGEIVYWKYHRYMRVIYIYKSHDSRKNRVRHDRAAAPVRCMVDRSCRRVLGVGGVL